MLFPATLMLANVELSPARCCNGGIRRSIAERKVMNSPMVSAPLWASKSAKATTTATPVIVMICVTGVPRPCMTCFFKARLRIFSLMGENRDISKS